MATPEHPVPLTAAPRLYYCPNGHILGQIFEDLNGGNALQLYNLSIDPTWPSPPIVAIVAFIRGWARVNCQVCRETRDWHPDLEELERQAAYRRRIRGPGYPH